MNGNKSLAPRRTLPAHRALAKLAEIAKGQDGFVSAAQAAAIAVNRHQLQRLVAAELLDRDDRGLYRLTTFPETERAELWRAVLWPSVQRGETSAVLSDGTALSLYDVSTINPNTIDLTIPNSLRLRRSQPPAVRVHRRVYSSKDVTRVDGLPATTLYRTLVDLITARAQLQFVDEALSRAKSRGLLTSEELRQLTALRTLDDRILSIVKARP